MPYVEGRVVHDADAHIMETPTWLRDHADPGIRERIAPLKFPGGNELRQTGDVEEQKRDLAAAFEKLAAPGTFTEVVNLSLPLLTPPLPVKNVPPALGTADFTSVGLSVPRVTNATGPQFLIEFWGGELGPPVPSA